MRAALPRAPPCALAEPRLVGEQNALGLGVWARCADLRVLRSQISTPQLVVKPARARFDLENTSPSLKPALPAALACDWTSLLVPTLTVCRAVRGAQSWTRRLGRHVFKGDVHNHAGGGGITGE